MKAKVDKMPKGKKLTQAEEDELYNKIQNSIDNFNPREPFISLEEQQWIRIATNSGSDRLYNQGSLFAYTIIKNRYEKLADKYQDSFRTEKEDLMSELYIAVHTNIYKYNGVHPIFTFFDPIVNAAFTIARGTGKGGGMSKYYQDVGVTIRRAENELSAKGYDNPSILDVRDYIKVRYGKNISESTIERYKKYAQDVESMDGSEKQFASDGIGDPEDIVMEEEKKLEFYKGLDKLSPRHRLLVMVELEHISKTGENPSIQEIFSAMKDQCENLTTLEVTQIQRAAHIELRGYFTRKKKRDLPVNKMRTLTTDFALLAEDEQNIVDAMANSDIDQIIPAERPFKEKKEETNNVKEINIDTLM